MHLTLEKGRGYVSAANQQKSQYAHRRHPDGFDLHADPQGELHRREHRVGQETDYDRLTLEVWTDGSIQADEAISTAAKILNGHLKLFMDLTDQVVTIGFNEKEDDHREKVLEMTIEELDLSVRAYNCLKRAGINTVAELVQRQSGRHDEGSQAWARSLWKKSSRSSPLWVWPCVPTTSNPAKPVTNYTLPERAIKVAPKGNMGAARQGLICPIGGAASCVPREELYLQEAGCNRRINKMAYQRKLGRTAAQRKALLRQSGDQPHLVWPYRDHSWPAPRKFAAPPST